MKKAKKYLIPFVACCFLCGSLPITTASASAGASNGTAVTDLRCEYMSEPLGIDARTPRFSWEMASDTRGQKQTAYRVIVAATEAKADAGSGDMWDSGRVASGRSVGVEYGGAALQSGARYYWKVLVWDKDGNELESGTTWFEMGLLDPSADWTAKFISAADAAASYTGAYTTELDFRVESDAAGFIFGGKDSGNFLMWQINIHDYAAGEKVYFRPHKWSGGNAACLDEIDISGAIPWEKRNDTNHLKIEVSSSNVITTSVNGAVIDARTDTLAAYGQIGFRQIKSDQVSERAYFDNVVIRDSSLKTLFTEDFNSGINPFADGAIVSGELYMAITGADMQKVSSGTSAPMFRREFTADPEKTLSRARLYASALGVYEVFINGEKVGADKLAPGWTDYTRYVQYQTFDVTDMLQSGENAIGAVVGNGWYSGHVSTGSGNVNKYGVEVAFIGQLELEYADGTTDRIATDDTWKSTKNGPYLKTDNQDGETYDARREIPGWDRTGFDDGAWSGTIFATKDSIDTKVDVENIGLVAQTGEPAAVTGELPVQKVTEPEDGVYIFDLGQNMVGWARLKATGDAGTTIRLRFGEMLQNDGTLYTANLRTAKATDYYTLKGDPDGEVYEPCFTFHGFRYVEVSSYPGVPEAGDITGVVVGSAIERTGRYETSNALVNQLYSNIIWGQRGNYLSVPTDCPQRDERLGWTGDAQVFVRTGTLNFNINQFFKKYLMDVRTAQEENGAVYDIAPRQGHAVGSGNAGWADVAVVAPWTIYTAYGDTQVIRDNYQMMKDWVDYCKNYALSHSSGKLIIPDCAYGDWLSIGESTPNNVVATAYFAYSAGLLSKMAGVIGENEDAAAYGQLFLDIRRDFNEKFVSGDGTVSGNSQTAYLLALKMNLLPTEELRQKAAAKLVGRIEASDGHLTTGFLGVSYLCPVLSEAGYSDIAYRLLLTETYPSWLYSVVNGATTIWERWNSYIAETGQFGDAGMNSFNHYSYGSIGEWMYRYSAGIEYDEENPGYKHIIIQPNPGRELSYVKGSYDSVYGTIESNWTMNGDAFALDVVIPANTTATVYLPSDDAGALTVDDAAYAPGSAGAEGVTYVGEEGGKAIFEIESGSYAFTSKILNRYTLSVGCGDEYILGQVEVNGVTSGLPYTGTFREGEEVTVRAVPVNSLEYKYSSWSGDGASGTNPLTVTMDGDKSLTADFSYIGRTNLALGKAAASESNDGNPPVWSRQNLTDGLYISTGTLDKGIKGYTSISHEEQDVSSSPEWVEIDLGEDRQFNRIQLYPRTDAFSSSVDTAGFPSNFTLSVKKNGESVYTTVYTGAGYTAPYLVPAVFDVGGQTARYVRLTVTTLGKMASDDLGYRLQLAEFGIYNVSDKEFYTLTLDKTGEGAVLVNGAEVTLPYSMDYGAGTEVTVQAKETSDFSSFTGWTGPSPSGNKTLKLTMNEDKAYTASFLSIADKNLALGKTAASNDTIIVPGAWGISRLTDGTTTGTGYSSNYKIGSALGTEKAIWVRADLGENRLADTVVLYPRTDGEVDVNGGTPNFPVDFEIQVSKDNTSYTTVKTITNEPNPLGEPQSYTFDLPVAARYVRVFVTTLGTKEVSDQGPRLQLTEMEIYNKNFTESIEITSPDTMEISGGGRIAADAVLSDGSRLDMDELGFPMTYESSNTGIATVSDSGAVVPVAEGTTTITATAEINGYEFTDTQALTITGSPEPDNPVPFDGAITVSNVTGAGLTLSWNIPDPAEAQDVSYQVYKSASGNIGTLGDILANGTAAGQAVWDDGTTAVTGLSPNTTYYFNIIATIEGNRFRYTMTSATTEGSGVPDTTAPGLAAGAAVRTSDTEAAVTFISDEAGQYYYAVAADGAGEPVIDTTGAGVACTEGETTITNPEGLSAGAMDIYIRVKDAAGNVSSALKIDIPAYTGQSRPFVIVTSGELDRSGGIKATAEIRPESGTDPHEGKETVVFRLMKGSTPVNIVAVEKDITSEETLTAYFNVPDPQSRDYTVKVFVFDRFDGDITAPVNLAEPTVLD